MIGEAAAEKKNSKKRIVLEQLVPGFVPAIINLMNG
jgi:hypothetical protein